MTFLAANLLLAGCGDNTNIQQVKEMVTFNDNTITVGNALDHRSVCEKVKWETVNDERHRDIVRYTCQISPNAANQLITRNINKSEQQAWERLSNDAHHFNEQNKEAQLSKFYLENGDKGLKEVSDSGISITYNQLKNELLQYLRNNYKVGNTQDTSKAIHDFELPKEFFKDTEEKQYIIQINSYGMPVNQSDEIDLTKDTYVVKTIETLLSIEQQALTILAGNNTGLDTKDNNGVICSDFSEKFPCNINRRINYAFSNLFFKQVPYELAMTDIHEHIAKYTRTREAMDKRDASYVVLKERFQQRISEIKQQSQLTKLEQRIDFSIIKEQQPTVASCDFIFTSTDGNTMTFAPSYCFRFAYKANWDPQFDNIIQSYYQEYIRPGLNTFIQQIDREAQSLWRVE